MKLPRKISWGRFLGWRTGGIAVATVIAVAILVALWQLTSLPAVPLDTGDWIVIADFENLTGDDVFDTSLDLALVVSLAQSAHVDVFPERRVNQALRDMRREIGYLDNETAVQVAQREGIATLLVPSISLIGQTYVVALQVEDAFTGEMLHIEVVQAEGKDHVLDALDELAARTRRVLGESRLSISLHQKPLSRATTASLEALKEYSLGRHHHVMQDFDEAQSHYESALRIDSSFTAARASLGILDIEQYDAERGKDLLDEAVQNIEDLTAREKYAILSFHASAVENDLAKAAEYSKTLLATYPDDEVAHNNLGWFYTQLERYEDAVGEYREAVRIDPGMVIGYCGLISAYVDGLGQLDSGAAWAKRCILNNDRAARCYNDLGWAYLGMDSLEEAKVSFQQALDLEPDFILDLYRLGHTYRLLGDHSQAIRQFRRILTIDPSETTAHYFLGVEHQLMHEDELAREHLEQFRRVCQQWVRDYPRNVSSYLWLAKVLARLGRPEQSSRVAEQAIALDSTVHFDLALLRSAQGATEEALDQLELAIAAGYHNYVWIKVHPDLQNLHTDPRFAELIRKGMTW